MKKWVPWIIVAILLLTIFLEFRYRFYFFEDWSWRLEIIGCIPTGYCN